MTLVIQIALGIVLGFVMLWVGALLIAALPTIITWIRWRRTFIALVIAVGIFSLMYDNVANFQHRSPDTAILSGLYQGVVWGTISWFVMRRWLPNL
jgi:hypothetical protein